MRLYCAGSEEHPWAARRNASGKGIVSAILVRALLSALDGSVLEARPGISQQSKDMRLSQPFLEAVSKATRPGLRAE